MLKLVGRMGRVKCCVLRKAVDKETNLQKAIQAAKKSEFPSLRQTAEAYNIALTTLRYRLQEGECSKYSISWRMLLTNRRHNMGSSTYRATAINISRRKGYFTFY